MPAQQGQPPLRLIILLTVLIVLLLAVLLNWFGTGGAGAERIDTAELAYTPRELPHLEDRLGRTQKTSPRESRRNPFTYGVPPTPTPDPNRQPTRTPPPIRRTTPPPLQSTHSSKPTPPPFDREYIGYFGPPSLQVAAFRKNSEIEVAAQGEVLDGVFIIRRIGLESVDIGFVGFAEEERERVPLVKN